MLPGLQLVYCRRFCQGPVQQPQDQLCQRFVPCGPGVDAAACNRQQRQCDRRKLGATGHSDISGQAGLEAMQAKHKVSVWLEVAAHTHVSL
jgi:hypothetical protein